MAGAFVSTLTGCSYEIGRSDSVAGWIAVQAWRKVPRNQSTPDVLHPAVILRFRSAMVNILTVYLRDMETCHNIEARLYNFYRYRGFSME